jgi:hypothetical protein
LSATIALISFREHSMPRKMKMRLPASRSRERSVYGVWEENPPLATPQAQPPYCKPAQRIIATLIFALAALALAAPLTAAPAYALTVLEQGWQVANAKCQDGDAKQCDLRERLSERLKRKGCLYQEDGGWWKCSRAH